MEDKSHDKVEKSQQWMGKIALLIFLAIMLNALLEAWQVHRITQTYKAIATDLFTTISEQQRR